MNKDLSNILIMLFLSSLMMMGCAENTQDKANSDTQSDEKMSEDASEKTEAVRPEEWSYQGDLAPENWGNLSPVYSLCGSGKSQSPINIVEQSEGNSQKWEFNYSMTDLHIAHNEHMEEIIDNGHTIQVSVDKGSHFMYNDKEYELKQFHFHTPSEHTIDGKNLPMEVHFVHQSTDGALAVVSILVNTGENQNENLAKLIEHLPTSKGEEFHPENVVLNIGEHLPESENAYAYSGSLTTPPCSEDVQWLILSEMVNASAEQIEAFSSVIGPNNRPVQNLNNREIDMIEAELKE